MGISISLGRKKSRQAGFTLVELLIVIVIIGILAAITTIAYNGITQKAHTATLESDLSQNATLLSVASAQNGTYPADQASADLKASAGTTLTYTASGNGYCLQAAANGQTYHITDENTDPTSGSCPAVQTETIFGNATPDDPDSSADDLGGDGGWMPSSSGYIFGLAFQASKTGTVTGVRFYKTPRETGTNIGYLWDPSINTASSPTGNPLLASVTFSSETASGWQTAYFSSPVAIVANKTYVIGYSDPSAYFPYSQKSFDSSDLVNGDLTALQDAENYPTWGNGDTGGFCTTDTTDYTGGDSTCAAHDGTNFDGSPNHQPGNVPIAGDWGANFYVDVVFTPN